MELLFQFVGEIIVQGVLELFFELGLRRVGASVAKSWRSWLAAIGYALLGAIAGGISLVVLPAHLLPTPTARIVNLVLTPVALGAAMVAVGRWRERRGQRLIRLDRFAYGYLFALAMTIVRLVSASEHCAR